MKKIICLCAAFFCAYQITNAQTQKGNQTLGLTLDYSHSSNTSSIINELSGVSTQGNNKYSSFNVGPSYGYFIANGSELGGGLSYFNAKQSYGTIPYSGDQSNSQNSNGYGVNVFFRKYVLYNNKFGFRVGPNVGYNRTKTTYTNSSFSAYNNGSSTSNGLSASGNFDLVYYPSNKLGFAATLASLNYYHNKTSGDINTGSNENFGLHFINSGLTLTAFLVFGGK
ncbi:hypothetical protein [Mucilaginibacter sp.]|uniref:hypothetical protein n=1 Tax=Mucilaginibacter sp. TaxID=1882438 RepID=UPI002620798F|nr:hypothetical protein [Mucilaginibacter sp.]MDB5029784.1 hypothetical protein [Mucilaginibacter sp.]